MLVKILVVSLFLKNSFCDVSSTEAQSEISKVINEKKFAGDALNNIDESFARKGISPIFYDRSGDLYHFSWHFIGEGDHFYFLDFVRYYDSKQQLHYPTIKLSINKANKTINESGLYLLQIYPALKNTTIELSQGELAEYNRTDLPLNAQGNYLAVGCKGEQNFNILIQKNLSYVKSLGKALSKGKCDKIQIFPLILEQASPIKPIKTISASRLRNVSIKVEGKSLKVEHDGGDIYNVHVRNIILNKYLMGSGKSKVSFDLNFFLAKKMIKSQINELMILNIIMQRTVVIFGDEILKTNPEVNLYYILLPKKSDEEITKNLEQWFAPTISSQIYKDSLKVNDVICTMKQGIDTNTYSFDSCHLVQSSFRFNPDQLKYFHP